MFLSSAPRDVKRSPPTLFHTSPCKTLQLFFPLTTWWSVRPHIDPFKAPNPCPELSTPFRYVLALLRSSMFLSWCWGEERTSTRLVLRQQLFPWNGARFGVRGTLLSSGSNVCSRLFYFQDGEQTAEVNSAVLLWQSAGPSQRHPCMFFNLHVILSFLQPHTPLPRKIPCCRPARPPPALSSFDRFKQGRSERDPSIWNCDITGLRRRDSGRETEAAIERAEMNRWATRRQSAQRWKTDKRPCKGLWTQVFLMSTGGLGNPLMVLRVIPTHHASQQIDCIQSSQSRCSHTFEDPRAFVTFYHGSIVYLTEN